MSKGSRQRTLNTDQFNDNYDRIFGSKNGQNESVPRQSEEEYDQKRGTDKESEKSL